MAHDVFISHSSKDKPIADAACAALENVAVRCWIAPRDVQPGRSFAGEITRAIEHSKVMVLIFSAHSNASEQVLREVQLAANSHLHIVQFRIQNVMPNDDLEYYLSTPHWLDALGPPLENHLERLKTSVKALLQLHEPEVAVSFPASAGERPKPSTVPASVASPASPPPLSVVAPSAPVTRRNLWMPALILAVVLCAILLAGILLRQRQPKVGVGPEASATPGQVRTNSPVPSVPAKNTAATPSAKGAQLFSHHFDSPTPIVKALFGGNIMSVSNANGEGLVTGNSPGILPAMFDQLSFDDFILECGMRAETVPPGARYGIIFRAADVVSGGIARYYALLLDPNKKVVVMMWWMDGKWMMIEEQPVPEGSWQIAGKSRLILEAVGNRFRAFINGRFAAEFHADGLKKGKIGLCLAGADSTPWTVRYDNFEIFMPRGRETSSETTTASAGASSNRPQPFERSWDFSEGMLPDIQSHGVELVDAMRWNMPGGKHMRFLTGGRSWLEISFGIPADAKPPTRLTVRHLSSSPDGKRPGYSPVRIKLNGAEVYSGSPTEKGWMENQFDLDHHAHAGTNRLLWEYLDGAQTHYWLKSFRVTSEQ